MCAAQRVDKGYSIGGHGEGLVLNQLDTHRRSCQPL